MFKVQVWRLAADEQNQGRNVPEKTLPSCFLQTIIENSDLTGLISTICRTNTEVRRFQTNLR